MRHRHCKPLELTLFSSIAKTEAREIKMTKLLIETESTPLTVNFPFLVQMTNEQFYEFCQANGDLRIERTVGGEVIIMPPAFSDTGNRNFNIAAQLGYWTELDGTGIGFDSSTGFTLPNGAMRSPDASWIKLELWNALTESQKASFAPICSNFVIELSSSSVGEASRRHRLTKLQDKMQEYIDNGASLGWLIDRKHRQVHIYHPHQQPEIWDNPAAVNGEPELPGFVLRMSKIW